MSFTLLPSEAFARARWKNGLGFTDQIAIHPADADLRRADFLWRVSSARIEQGAPFSAFPAHDRILMVIRGAGLHLWHGGDDDDFKDETELPPFEAHEFPGEIPSGCELIDGPITDLSVFLRKGEAGGQVEAFRVERDQPIEWNPLGQCNFLFAAQGPCRVTVDGLGEPLELREGDALRWDATEGQPVPQIEATGRTARVVQIGLQW